MRLRVILIGTAVALAGLLAAAPAASAHVSVSAPDATQGGYTVLTFQVPTESDTASTTGLRVQLPLDAPFAAVQVQPHHGWTFTTKQQKLTSPIRTDDGDTVSEAVSEIDWTAGSPVAAIRPGEFDLFRVSVGPLPKAASITFKVIQLYSDGSEVAWIEVPAPGSSAEPEHPAPTLALAAPAGATDAAALAGPTVSATPSAGGAQGGSNTGAVILALVALVLAAGAAVLAGAAYRSSRTSRTAA